MSTMPTELPRPIYHKPLVYLNRFLVFLQVFILGGLATIMTSRIRFQAISDSIFEETDLLMNSAFADFVVRNESVLILIVLVVGLFIKEKRLTEIGVKITTNLLGGVMLSAFSVLLIQTLYQV